MSTPKKDKQKDWLLEGGNPNAILLEPVDHQSSKSQELTLLHLVRNLFKDGSYLKTLFSEGLLNWVNERLEQDRNCDLFAEHQSNMVLLSSRAMSLEDQQRDFQRAMEQQAQDYARTIQEQGNRLRAAMQELEDTQGLLQISREANRVLHQMVNQRDQELLLMSEQMGLAAMELADTNLEIMRLKAMLWDTVHPSG